MILKDTEWKKRNQLWFIHESVMAWIGFYKQNNKFGNYDRVIGPLVNQEKVLRNRRFPSKILED